MVTSCCHRNVGDISNVRTIRGGWQFLILLSNWPPLRNNTANNFNNWSRLFASGTPNWGRKGKKKKQEKTKSVLGLHFSVYLIRKKKGWMAINNLKGYPKEIKSRRPFTTRGSYRIRSNGSQIFCQNQTCSYSELRLWKLLKTILLRNMTKK